MTTPEKPPLPLASNAQASFDAASQDGPVGMREAYYAYNLMRDVQRHHQRLFDWHARPAFQRPVADRPTRSPT